MKLIVECGATKSQWTLLPAAPAAAQYFFTGGMNFSSGEEDYLFSTLQEGLRWVDSALAAQHDAAATEPQTTSAQPVRDADVSEVNFYAAGLFPGTERYERLEALMSAAFPGAAVCFESDLLAAARAVCGHSAGVAVILGTGSNACLYDGSRIVKTVPSGGFILGDEGSASALGRRFVSDYIKGLVPEAMAAHFASRFDMAYPALVHEVYHGASPAGFLGKFAPEILGFYAIDPYAKAIVDDNFRSFIRRCLIPLLSSSAAAPRALPVGVVGGFGCAYREILSAVGAEEGVDFARFLASPSDELIAYHQ